jgi:hypothetical protein
LRHLLKRVRDWQWRPVHANHARPTWTGRTSA